GLGAAAADERGGAIGAQDEHDAGVIGEHAEADEGAQGTVDLVVHADAEDVPAEGLLGHLPEESGEERARERRARGHAMVREVAIHDEGEHGAESRRQGEGERVDRLGWHLPRIEDQDAHPRKEIEDEDAAEEKDPHAEEEDQILADLPQEAGTAVEAEDPVQHEAKRGEELAGEDQQHHGAQDAAQASPADDLAERLVELALVHGNDGGELVEHQLGGGPPAQDEAGEGHDEEENGNETGEEAEGEACGLKEPPGGAKVRDRRAKNPPALYYTTLLIRPPSTCTTQPVTYEARSEPRNTPMSANSSGRPMRPMGMSGVARVASHSSSDLPARAARSV